MPSETPAIVPTPAFRQPRDEYIELREVGDLVSKPVRNLSLGERMKMEIIAALLHRPEVLFLDDLTIEAPPIDDVIERAFASPDA